MPTILTVRVEGMHCASCGMVIDDALADLPAVHCSRTSVRTGLATVELSDDTANPAALVTAITELGYTATITDSGSPAGGD